ncbi:Probable allantoinase 1 [Galdieria sulphuraria]|nr:Probable allantoinase 1 [Galdieria sulphuraria]
MIHAELASSKFSPNNYEGPSMSYMAFMRSRPDSFEVNAVQALIELSRKTHCPVYIVHISSADAAELVKQAKEEGIQILPKLVRNIWHLLQMIFRMVIQSLNNLFDLIASDHAPATPEEKCLEQGNVRMAYAGISGLQYRLPAVWTAL